MNTADTHQSHVQTENVNWPHSASTVISGRRDTQNAMTDDKMESKKSKHKLNIDMEPNDKEDSNKIDSNLFAYLVAQRDVVLEDRLHSLRLEQARRQKQVDMLVEQFLIRLIPVTESLQELVGQLLGMERRIRNTVGVFPVTTTIQIIPVEHFF